MPIRRLLLLLLLLLLLQSDCRRRWREKPGKAEVIGRVGIKNFLAEIKVFERRINGGS